MNNELNSATQPQAAMPGWKLLPVVPTNGVTILREFADAVKSLCNDYSSRSGSVYIGDVSACIDALHDQYAKPTGPAIEPVAGLTDGDIERIDDEVLGDKSVRGDYCRRFARAIERHLTGNAGDQKSGAA